MHFTCESAEAYQTGDIALLIARVHKFHAGVCYTETPHLLHTLKALETGLRNGEHARLDALYGDMLKAMDMVENIYQSL